MHQFWVRIEPWAYRGALVALVAGVLFAAWSFMGKPVPWKSWGATSNGRMVTFDVVRLANAQRAVASAFVRPESATPDAATGLMAMRKATREVIEQVAGPGTVVLVKQAVVSDHLPDITDEVLKELGLPLKVPTQDPTAYTLDEAPTNLSLMPGAVAPRQAPAKLPPNGSGEKVIP